MSDPWTCPKCGVTYAPWVMKCECRLVMTASTDRTEKAKTKPDATPAGIICAVCRKGTPLSDAYTVPGQGIVCGSCCNHTAPPAEPPYHVGQKVPFKYVDGTMATATVVAYDEATGVVGLDVTKPEPQEADARLKELLQGAHDSIAEWMKQCCPETGPCHSCVMPCDDRAHLADIRAALAETIDRKTFAPGQEVWTIIGGEVRPVFVDKADIVRVELGNSIYHFERRFVYLTADEARKAQEEGK